MIKRKPLMYFTMVIALLGVFVATNAFALDECPATDSCTAGKYTLTAVPENGQFPVKTTCYDGDGISWPCYKYEYSFSGAGDVSKIDHVYFGIPHDCYDPIKVFEEVYWSTTGVNRDYYHVDYYPPCVGGGTFANFVCNVRVVRISPQGNKATFFTETDRNGSGSFYVSAGKSKSGCEDPIIAPGYNPISPQGGRTFSECANFGQDTSQEPLDDVSFYMVRSSDDAGCITKIWACEGLNCPQCADELCPPSDFCEEITPEGLPDEYVLQASFLRSCPDENVSVTHSSPYYLYKFYSGGRLYKLCLNTLNGQWTTLNYCGQ